MKQFDVCEILLKTNLTYLKLTECFSVVEEFLWLENVTTNRDIYVNDASFSVKTNQQNLVETWKYLRDMFLIREFLFDSLSIPEIFHSDLKVLVNHKMVPFY